MCLLVGQGSVIGALLCNWNLLHARQYAVPVSCRTLSFSHFQPWMSILLNRTQLVLSSISRVQRALLCLARFSALREWC